MRNKITLWIVKIIASVLAGFCALILLTLLILLLHDRYIYDPIDKQQYDMMFSSYKKIRTIRTSDELGLDWHGNLFDITEYKLKEPVFNYSFPSKENLIELGHSYPPFGYFCQWEKCSNVKMEFIPKMGKGDTPMQKRLFEALSKPDNLYCLYNHDYRDVFCAVYDFATDRMYYLHVDL